MRNRKQYFIDPKVQGALMLRVAGYWFFCLLTMTIALLIWRLLTGPARMFYLHFDDLWYWYGPAAISSMLLLPLVLIDCVRMTNRFAGPLYRLRRELRKLAAGEKVPPIAFRNGDFWHDFAEEFNAVSRRMEILSERAEQAERSAAKADRIDGKDFDKLAQLGSGQRIESTPLVGVSVGDAFVKDDLSGSSKSLRG
jgi:hypothetical protein